MLKVQLKNRTSNDILAKELLDFKKKTSWSWEIMSGEFQRVMHARGPSSTTLFRYAKGRVKRPNAIVERYVTEAMKKLQVEPMELALSGGKGVKWNAEDTTIAFRDVTRSGELEKIMRWLVGGTSLTVGERFFSSLVRHLAMAFGVRFAFVSELRGSVVKTLAYWEDGDWSVNFEYDVEGTPCQYVFENGLAYYPANVQELFPEDFWLKKNRIESYLAVPLYDPKWNAIGHLGLMDDKPMKEDPYRESILRIFGARAGAELERRQAEALLQQSEERLRNLIERTNDIVWEINQDGAYTYISPQVQDILGYSPEEVIGKTPFDFMPKDEAERVSQIFSQVIREAGPFTSLTHKCLCKNGKVVFMECSGAPIFDSEQTLQGYRGVDRDITERSWE